MPENPPFVGACERVAPCWATALPGAQQLVQKTTSSKPSLRTSSCRSAALAIGQEMRRPSRNGLSAPLLPKVPVAVDTVGELRRMAGSGCHWSCPRLWSGCYATFWAGGLAPASGPDATRRSGWAETRLFVRLGALTRKCGLRSAGATPRIMSYTVFRWLRSGSIPGRRTITTALTRASRCRIAVCRLA